MNRRFLPLASTFLRSLKKNYPAHPPVIFLHYDLDARHTAQLERVAGVSTRLLRSEDVKDVAPSTSIRGVNANYRDLDPRVIFARFALWRPAFDDFDKIAFLDVDIVILKPFDALFDAATPVFTRECLVPNQNFSDEDAPALKAACERFGVPVRQATANAGAFMLPRAWRSDDHFNDLVRISQEFDGHLIFADQSIINVWLWRQRIEARSDVTFNFQMKRVRALGNRAFEDAAIAHFNGMDNRLRAILMPLLLRLHGNRAGRLAYPRMHDTVLRYFRARDKNRERVKNSALLVRAHVRRYVERRWPRSSQT